MTTVTLSEKTENNSDPVLLNYNPNSYGRMLMNESISQPSGGSYAARTEIVKSDRTDCGLDEEG